MTCCTLNFLLSKALVGYQNYPQKGEKMAVAVVILTANSGVLANDLTPLNKILVVI